MTTDRQHPPVPKLRFPEFRNAGDWHFQPLSGIAELISEKVGTSKCVPMSVTTGVGLLSQEEKFGRIIAGNSYKNYIRLQTNDFAYNKSATKEFPQGYIARYSGAKDAAVPNSIFTCFRPRSTSIIPEYLDYLLHGNHHGQWLRKYITVGARAHGALSVANDALMSLPVPLPPIQVLHSEQQKIADCLGSLDDLIAAEGQKLEALRQHEKGLMQQLFPQPGETMPKLRFPEFREAPRWVQTPLRDAFKIITNGQANAQDHRDDATYPLFDRSEVVKRSPTFLFDAEAVILPGEGMRFQPRYFNGKFNLHQRAYALMGPTINPCYAFHALDRFKGTLADSAVKSTVLSLRMPIIEKFTIPCPTSDNEQQKIAVCLGSLDDLIAAEGRKLEALQQHKKGLMQQLFPGLEME